MTTATAPALTDQTHAAEAIEALTKAMALLDQAGQVLPQIAFLTRAARDSADTALMIANHALKTAAHA